MRIKNFIKFLLGIKKHTDNQNKNIKIYKLYALHCSFVQNHFTNEMIMVFLKLNAHITRCLRTEGMKDNFLPSQYYPIFYY